MANLVTLEEIEEFSVVRRVPRTAITDEVLEGVRKLLEREEIEPFLRSIISDTIKTPHGSTEIADILTTHVTYGGRPRLAAFVNKGRATPKVRRSDVGDQVLRLADIPNVDLMVLLAVGDIHDDIKMSLLNLAQLSGADHMVADARDVARLFIAYQKICPRDGTPFSTGHCQLCGKVADEPIELTIKLYEDLYWEFLEQRDSSHAGAKRYSANVLTDRHYQKAAIREVVKEAAWELRHADYYRSSITQSVFGPALADCIFLFVYLALEDTQHTNWICRAQWVRPHLSEDFKPIKWPGEEIPFNGDEQLGSIVLDWNQEYEARRAAIKRGTKQEWIEKVESLLPKMELIAEQAAEVFDARLSGALNDDAFVNRMQALEVPAMEIYRLTDNEKTPPVECKEANRAFQSLATMFHNILVPFAHWSRMKRDWKYHNWHVRTYLDHYKNDRQAFLHEWKKIR